MVRRSETRVDAQPEHHRRAHVPDLSTGGDVVADVSLGTLVAREDDDRVILDARRVDGVENRAGILVDLMQDV